MSARAVVPVLLLLLLLAGPVQASLPAKVHLETPTRTFTHEYYLALEEGRLWLKRIRGGAWEQVKGGGLPDGKELTAISADGDNLIAITKQRQVYYAKLATYEREGGHVELDWKDAFGKPKYFLGRNQKLWLPARHRGFAISHRGPFVGGYEDIDGNFHWQTAGVTTLYLLAADGLSVRYTDPWIPAHFDRQLNLPEAGGKRFRAVSLSASASTMFVINAAGDMYTRLADFDTVGENPVLQYSFTRSYDPSKRSNRAWNEIRSLPGAWWTRQPRIHGRITDVITIHQTAKTSAARVNERRELRVEGVQGRDTGYYAKPIALYDRRTRRRNRWRFVKTAQPLRGKLLRNGEPEAVPPRELWGPALGHDYRAQDLTSTRLRAASFSARLLGFHPRSRRARLVFQFAEGIIEVGVHTYRIDDYAPRGKIRAAILRPPSTSPYNPVLSRRLDTVFGERNHVKVNLRLSEDGKSVSMTPRSSEDMERFEITFSRE